MYQQLKHIVDDDDLPTMTTDHPKSYDDADRDDSDDCEEKH